MRTSHPSGRSPDQPVRTGVVPRPDFISLIADQQVVRLKSMKRFRMLTAVVTVVATAVFLADSYVHRPGRDFLSAIASADRVVFTADGFFRPTETLRIGDTLAEITDPELIDNLSSAFSFRRSWSRGSCACEGFPRVEWFQNGKRVATASLQHREAIRWHGLGFDMQLTPDSTERLVAWCERQSIPTDGF